MPSYLNLSANIPSLIAAHAVPLSLAPAVTTVWAFLIQLLPFAVVLFGDSRVWTSLRHRLIVSGVLLFGPPVLNGEVWLNSGNSQVFCGILVMLLCEETDNISHFRRWTYIALVAFCVLSGPYTVFLAPAFIMKARLDGSVGSRIHAWIVSVGVVLQASLHVWTRIGFPYSPSRIAKNDWPERAVALFQNDVVYPFLGHDLSNALLGNLLSGSEVQGGIAPQRFGSIAGLLSLIGLVAIIGLLVHRSSRPETKLVAVSLCRSW